VTAAPPWVRGFVGRPFAFGGRGPEAFDCWGLVRAVLADRFAIALPGYEAGYPASEADREDLAGLISRHLPDWRPAGEPAPGDVVLMRHGRHPCHVGVVVAPRLMLHAEEGTGAVLEPWDGPRWARKVVGIFRYAKAAP
jgi:cell wall-associated NlpC family hydrolase